MELFLLAETCISKVGLSDFPITSANWLQLLSSATRALVSMASSLRAISVLFPLSALTSLICALGDRTTSAVKDRCSNNQIPNQLYKLIS